MKLVKLHKPLKRIISRVPIRTWIGIGVLGVLLPLAFWKLFFKPEVSAATMSLTTSSTQVQVDVSNRYRMIMNKGDTDDYMIFSDRAQSDTSPNQTYEFIGPNIQEGANVPYQLRWDSTRVTTIIESTDTRIKVRVSGCLDTSGGGACLKDNSNAASDDIIFVTEDYTFTPDGMFVTNSTNFQDNGITLDNDSAVAIDAEDGYNWLMIDADVTDASFSGTIYYGDGETDSSRSTDTGVSPLSKTTRYFVFESGGTGYQSGIIALPRSGWFDDGDGLGASLQNWNYDAANSGNQDRLHSRVRNLTTTGIHSATWSFRLFSSDKLDTDLEREQMINAYSNPDVLTYATGSEWNDSAYPSSGINFDGSNDYITATGNNDTRLTFSMWVRTEDTTLRGIATMAESPGSSTHDRNLYLNTTGNFVARIFDGASKRAIGTSVAQSNTWYHIAMTYDGTNLKLYVNGVNEATTASGNPFTGYSTPEFIVGQTFGSIDGETVLFFDGQIDEVRVYDTALTQAQIHASMYSHISGSASNLKNYYRYNEATGTTAFDETSNNFDATFGASTAAPTWTSGYVADQFNDSEAAYTVTASENQTNFDIDGGTNVSSTTTGTVSVAATTMTLTDASNFPSSGTAYIEGDRFTYTSKSGNILQTIPSSGEDAVVGHVSGAIVSMSNRVNPSYKIGGYRDTRTPSLITQEGTTLRKGQDYNISQKPVTSSTWGQDINWYSTLESSGSVTSPDVGSAGTVASGVTFTTAKYGNGVLFNANSENITIPVASNLDEARGAIEFWVKPNWDQGDNTQHNFVSSSTGAFQMGKGGSGNGNALFFDHGAGVTNVASGNYSLKRGNWYHFRIEWDENEDTENQQKIFMNGVELTDSDSGDLSAASTNPGSDIAIGEIAARNCDCIIDEFRLYGGNGPVTLAAAGQAGNNAEFLSRADNNQTFSFVAIDGSNRGEYLTLGSDTQVSGFNIDLATNGVVGSSPNLDWEYWNGTAWTSLETVTGFSDGTAQLTQDGSIYWTATPPGWSPYSMNASPDLYYIRASLGSGSYNSSSYPVESQIFTDVVTLQTFTTLSAVDTTIQMTGGPIPSLIWKFDEGQGTTANDSSGFDNRGTVSGALWKTEDLCISGKCLYFDGSNDFVTRADDPDLDAVDNFTIGGWFRHKVSTTGVDIIAAKYNATSAGYKVVMEDDGDITCAIDHDATYTPTFAATSTAATYDDDTWHNFACVKSGTSTLNLYIDGALITSTSITGVGSLVNSDSFYIGVDGGGVSNAFEGFIDEIKVYQYARSASEIKTDFLREAAMRGSSAVLGASDDAFLDQGLVGYWKMDEAAWTNNCIATTVIDSSGEGNTGKDCGATAAATGKFGNGGDFDGTDDYISVADTSVLEPANDMTISAWVKFDTLPSTRGEDAIVAIKHDSSSPFFSYQLIVSTGGAAVFQWVNSSRTTYSASMAISGIATGTWYHVAGTKVGSTITAYVNGSSQGSTQGTTTGTILNSANALEFGSVDGTFSRLDGKLDEERIYNRGLSPKEIRALYNFAPGPISYYKFDENTGTAAADSSGSNLALTVNGASSNSWIPGKYGSSVKYSSTVYASASDNTNFEPPNDMTVTGWFRLNALPGGTQRILVYKDHTSTPFYSYQVYINTSNQVSFDWSNSSGTNFGSYNDDVSITTDTWYHFAAVKEATTIKVHVNAVPDPGGATTVSGTILNSDSTFSVNSPASGSRMDGTIDEVKVYNYARTQAQITEDMNGGHPLGGSPAGSQVALWNLDEQRGTITNNSIAANSVLTGALTGTPTWKTKESCKMNGCLDFDGTDDVMTVDNTASTAIDFDINLHSGFTFSAWISPDTAGEGTGGQVFYKGTNTWLRVDTLSGGKLDIEGSVDLATTDATLNVSAPITQSAWNHVALSYTDDSDDELTIWVNGRPVGTSTNGVGAPAATDIINLLIGGITTNNFDGKIDDVKVYSSELTLEQIGIDMTANSGVNFGTSQDEAAQLSDGAGTPPIGLWNFDENTSTTANDSSGNNRPVTLNANFSFNHDSGWTPGKYGSALHFDGTNDVAAVVTDAFDFVGSGNFTVETWVNVDTLNATLNSRILAYEHNATNGFHFIIYAANNGTCPSRFAWQVRKADVSFTSGCSASNSIIVPGTWYHLTGVFNGSTDTSTLYVNGVAQAGTTGTAVGLTAPGQLTFASQAAAGSNLLDGAIDTTTIYDYARSRSQISYDYNRGKPVGWWKLDGCSGTTAYDASGNSYNGTISIGATGSNTGAGNCNSGNTAEAWNNGTTGKLNSSLDFDGTDDFVDIGNTARTDIWAISFWAKPSDTTEKFLQLSASDSIEVSSGTVTVTGFGTETVYVDGRQTTTFPDANWHHVTVVSSSAITANDVELGRISSTYLNGQLDDVRIYNYTLSATQAKKNMNDDSGVRFGPVTGQP
jgi:hypothetical protein